MADAREGQQGRLAARAGLALAAACAVVYVSGARGRGYAVMPPEARLRIGERTWSMRGAAETFAPLIVPLDPADPPRRCYVEALPPRGNVLRLLYRFSWSDERHPVAALDGLYRVWRTVYFGAPEDIEYVLVEADGAARVPRRLIFESPETGAVFVWHYPRVLEQGGFAAAGTRPVLRVASWNHLFEAAATTEGAVAPPLEFLDDAAFRRLRLALRSLPPDDAPVVRRP